MDTHLSQFYGTNHVPTDAELLEIEKLLEPYNSRLSQLKKDLEEAEAKVAVAAVNIFPPLDMTNHRTSKYLYIYSTVDTVLFPSLP